MLMVQLTSIPIAVTVTMPASASLPWLPTPAVPEVANAEEGVERFVAARGALPAHNHHDD